MNTVDLEDFFELNYGQKMLQKSVILKCSSSLGLSNLISTQVSRQALEYFWGFVPGSLEKKKGSQTGQTELKPQKFTNISKMT